MNVKLILIGKTDLKYLDEGIGIFEKRLSHYVNFEKIVIPDIKNRKSLSEAQQKQKEGEQIKAQLKKEDFVVLLDEKGKQYTSVGFADYMQRHMLSGIKSLVFIIGGPYGFSEEIYKLASQKISLSSMTFSHQMIRLLFVEQLYRGFTIIRGESYHHV